MGTLLTWHSGGRFRPFSQVEIKGKPSLAERLVPPPEWNWDQARVVAAFDAIVAEVVRVFVLLMKLSADRAAAASGSDCEDVPSTLVPASAGP